MKSSIGYFGKLLYSNIRKEGKGLQMLLVPDLQQPPCYHEVISMEIKVNSLKLGRFGYILNWIFSGTRNINNHPLPDLLS